MALRVKKGRVRRRGYAHVSRKNQITLPVDALRRAGIASGDDLRVDVVGKGRIALVRDDDPLERYAGTFRYPTGYLRKLRSEWRE
jgi:bifunctional DNA-binding transcriptional regulator/antitoxin component of YhaV-PrlF toxin-antitoxin module